MIMEDFHFISIQQVYTKLESTGVPIDFSLIVYNIQFTTSKHNFWFITSSYSSHFQKYLAYAPLHASQEHQSNYCLIQCVILFLLQASRNNFLFRQFSFYGSNIWHSKQAFSPPNVNIRSLKVYFKRYPLSRASNNQIHASPTTSGGQFMYAMMKFYGKYPRTYLNTGVIIH